MAYVTSIEQLGIEKGRQEGAASVSIRLAKRKFGSIELGIEETIQKLSVEQLEELDEALFDFKDKADLINWISQRQPK